MNNYLQSFHENDHRIFLLHSIDRNHYSGKPQCTCHNSKCTAVGKHPTNENWQRTPQWDDDAIEGMEMAVAGGRGYGVLCDNLLVVDVDVRNGGGQSFKKLIKRFPEIAGSGMIVETGRGDGSKHYYFKLPKDVLTKTAPKDIDGNPEFPGIDFKHSGFVVGPGSPHASGKDYVILSGSIDEIDDAPSVLVDYLKREPFVRVEYEGSHIDVSEGVIASMLSVVTCYNDYEDWVKVGMAVHHASNGSSVDLWRDWSKQSSKYDPEDIDAKWHSFGKNGANPVTVASLIKMAKDNGWIEPVSDSEPEMQGWFLKAVTGSSVVTPSASHEFKEAKSQIKSCPIDLSNIDLTMPPGFTGDITRWINSQSMYPRKNLSALAALFVVGNIAGLRFMEDSPQKTRTNLAIFCVAGSGTGKDAVLNATRKLLIKAGMGPAVHGGIKSDKEITQNLIRHQAAIYTIDEIGGRLGKISQSRKGGATHLDGVMESFMEIFTKANSSHTPNGDTKEEIQKLLRERYSFLAKKIEENEDKSGRLARELESVEKRLQQNGIIENPFLSMIGFTTPRQFGEIMTMDNVETGFLGRSIMCIEPDDNPRENPDFTGADIGPTMQMRLNQIAWDGSETSMETVNRVEQMGQLVPISKAEGVQELLYECREWIWLITEENINLGKSYFDALYRRMFEKVIKVALILGIPGGIIEREHVAWAMALAIRDMDEKTTAVTIEDKSFKASERLHAAILKAIKSKPGITMRVLHGWSNLRKYQKEDVEKATQTLKENGLLTIKDDIDRRNNSPLIRFYVA